MYDDEDECMKTINDEKKTIVDLCEICFTKLTIKKLADVFECISESSWW